MRLLLLFAPVGEYVQHERWMSTPDEDRTAVADLHGSQLRAARAFTNLTLSDLAGLTGLAVNTIRRAEATDGPCPITETNKRAIVEALKNAGVTLLAANEKGVGVRFARPEAI